MPHSKVSPITKSWRALRFSISGSCVSFVNFCLQFAWFLPITLARKCAYPSSKYESNHITDYLQMPVAKVARTIITGFLQ
jgi:hypothetical protein